MTAVAFRSRMGAGCRRTALQAAVATAPPSESILRRIEPVTVL
jgi:hypothetical protein